MSYPAHLLPKPDYQKIAWDEKLLGYLLVRATPSKDIVDDETGFVRAKYVNDGSREQLKDYSTNLLGIFRTEDAAIQLQKTERKPYLIGAWEMGEAVAPPTDEDFSMLGEYGVFFYTIKALQHFPQPFSIANIPDYVGHCYVIHTPTRANFWHFSVRWKMGAEDIEQVLTESQRKNLLGLVRSFLIEQAITSIPENTPMQIAESWYTAHTN